jgi:hypothetical protein
MDGGKRWDLEKGNEGLEERGDVLGSAMTRKRREVSSGLS